MATSLPAILSRHSTFGLESRSLHEPLPVHVTTHINPKRECRPSDRACGGFGANAPVRQRKGHELSFTEVGKPVGRNEWAPARLPFAAIHRVRVQLVCVYLCLAS